ncbi:MAG: hypothetical protein ACT4PE_18190 [Candidatus Eiseniibacteriota bacterium]
MKKRTVALALMTAWVCTFTSPWPVDAAKLPIMPIEPGHGGGGPESDPWVPDDERPTKAFAGVQNGSVDDARIAPPTTRTEAPGWFVRLLLALRSLAFGGGR